MNFYNPYFASYPYYSALNPTTMGAATNAASRTGLFSRLFSGINLSSILSGTQKTLNIANQALPLIRQVQPMMHNAKTMFKVMNEFKKVDTPINTETNNTTINNDLNIENNEIESKEYSEYGPTFFN